MTAFPGNIENGPTIHAPFMQKPLSVIDTAFNVYGYLPDDGDERWEFLAEYAEVKARVPFKPVNFDNAWGATYLSEEPSHRTGYVTTVSPENRLQLERALDNLDSIPDVKRRFEASGQIYDATTMQYTVTDRLTTDPTKPIPAVTPCPEALHQIRLYDEDGYLARVGFNVHDEDEEPVVSIVNIQGTPGSKERNANFKKEHGIAPYNALVQRVIAMTVADDAQLDLRGMINPERGNARLYWGVLDQENIPMFKAHRKEA